MLVPHDGVSFLVVGVLLCYCGGVASISTEQQQPQQQQQRQQQQKKRGPPSPPELKVERQSTSKENHFTLRLPHGKGTVQVCDNAIIRDIPGGPMAVLQKGKDYIESMKNNTRHPIAKFTGQWKFEVDRVQMPMLPTCSHMTVFGDESKNYDEAKRFCYLTPGASAVANSSMATVPTAYSSQPSPSNGCVVYSIGSNNKWDFEEHIYRNTPCSIETFDCTIDATIPATIRNRTQFHKYCLGHFADKVAQQVFLTLPELNAKVGRKTGPDYFKVDIEGFEWAILKSLVGQVHANRKLDAHLPRQIYGEFHLDMDKDVNLMKSRQGGLQGIQAMFSGSVHRSPFTGARLRSFFDELFLHGGYMIMHKRPTLQSRNTDLLLVKAFCAL
jgi:hypothetical protein